ncbi:ribonuclease H-like domain-containing protein [Mycena epipterygia]|nr:ribonuclease H-like domain-containing protein [Mycena epipterygia]
MPSEWAENRRAECEAQVKGFHDAKYKKFNSPSEAKAWIAGNGSPVKSSGTSSEAGGSDNKGKKRMRVPDESIYDVVYSDGACKGNGQSGSVAGVGVWWGRDDPRNIAERCPGAQTNNRAELIAILRILETAPPSDRPLLIKSDSKYSIRCVWYSVLLTPPRSSISGLTEWLDGWRRSNFVASNGEPVKNPELIKFIAAHLDARNRRGQKVVFEYVKAHNGEEGNEGADAQANLGTLLKPEKERDWVRLLAELQESLKKELDVRNKPEPVLLEVSNQRDGLELRDPGESPTKMRKISAVTSKPKVMEAAIPNPLPAAEARAPLDPLQNATAQSSSVSASEISPQDWEQYADCLVDDHDLLADLSD